MSWPYDDHSDESEFADVSKDAVKAGTIRKGDCEEPGCTQRNVDTGVSVKDGRRICPFCLHRRRAT